MQLLNYTNSNRINIPSTYDLYCWGDTHVGNPGLHEEAILHFRRYIKAKKNRFFVHLGDACEAITLSDKRYELDMHMGRAGRVMDQIREVVDWFNPIADRGLCFLEGNHEHKLHNTIKITDEICRELNMDNGTYTAKLVLNDIKGLIWHGAGIVNPRAGDKRQIETNKQIAIKRKLRWLPGGDADWLGMGHIHQLIIHPPDDYLHLIDDGKNLKQVYPSPGRIVVDKKRGLYRIPEEDRWYFSSGSALRQYLGGVSGYAERAGYPPSEIGCIKISVKNDKLKNIEKVYLGTNDPLESVDNKVDNKVDVRKVA